MNIPLLLLLNAFHAFILHPTLGVHQTPPAPHVSRCFRECARWVGASVPTDPGVCLCAFTLHIRAGVNWKHWEGSSLHTSAQS